MQPTFTVGDISTSNALEVSVVIRRTDYQSDGAATSSPAVDRRSRRRRAGIARGRRDLQAGPSRRKSGSHDLAAHANINCGDNGRSVAFGRNELVG